MAQGRRASPIASMILLMAVRFRKGSKVNYYLRDAAGHRWLKIPHAAHHDAVQNQVAVGLDVLHALLIGPERRNLIVGQADTRHAQQTIGREGAEPRRYLIAAAKVDLAQGRYGVSRGDHVETLRAVARVEVLAH